MTNILIEGEHIPSYDMTVITFERFSKILPIKVRPVLTREVSSKDLRWCDIYICIRGNNPLSSYLCKKAKKQGCKLILMLDDDLLSHTSTHHPIYDKICKKSLESIIKLSDIILTPSEHLGKKYHRLFDIKYIITDTVVDPIDIKDNWNKSDKVRLLYAASHMHSFQNLVLPILNKLYERYKDSISMTIIGGHIDLQLIKLPIKHVNSMPYEEYRNYMKTNSFDIGLAPLIESEMVKSKYFNKYLEYTTQGICGIYSNNLPYTYIIKDSVNGLFSNNDSQSWFETICKLIDDENLRIRCVNEAQSELAKEFSIESITKRLCGDISWLTIFKKQPNNNLFFKIPSYPLFLIQESCRRFLKLLKNQ